MRIEPIGVVLADDVAVLRAGLARLTVRRGCEVVGEAGDATTLCRLVDELPARRRRRRAIWAVSVPFLHLGGHSHEFVTVAAQIAGEAGQARRNPAPVRAIHVANLDKPRPVVLLTREIALPVLTRVTVATITSTVRGLATEVAVGPRNGLADGCAVSCDNILTIHRDQLGRQIGYLLDEQESLLTAAIVQAFDLVV